MRSTPHKCHHPARTLPMPAGGMGSHMCDVWHSHDVHPHTTVRLLCRDCRHARAVRLSQGDTLSDDALIGTLRLAQCLSHVKRAPSRDRRVEEVVALYREAYQGFKEQHGMTNPNTLMAIMDLSTLHLATAEGLQPTPAVCKEVLQMLLPVYDLLSSAVKGDYEAMEHLDERLAICWTGLQRHDLAVPLLQRVVQWRRSRLGPHHDHLREAENMLSMAQSRCNTTAAEHSLAP